MISGIAKSVSVLAFAIGSQGCGPHIEPLKDRLVGIESLELRVDTAKLGSSWNFAKGDSDADRIVELRVGESAELRTFNMSCTHTLLNLNYPEATFKVDETAIACTPGVPKSWLTYKVTLKSYSDKPK
ncbi:MAG: hypothetical protein AABZ08_02235 [Planctomycetota bacterium]